MVEEAIKNIKSFLPMFKCKKKYLYMILLSGISVSIISAFSPAVVSNILTSIIDKKYNKILSILLFFGIIKLIQLLFLMLNSKVFYKIRKELLITLKNKI